jgi:hypothetical protein
MAKARVDLRKDDMYMNYTNEDTQLMNKATSRPWRGAREKDARFLQFFIEGTTEEGDLILDCTASTGKSWKLINVHSIYKLFPET